MANVNLTQRDIDYISRVVDTEVPRSLARTDPERYGQMVRGVVDTITNRIASSQFPNTAVDVLNQPRQFSMITGPASIGPYGSVQAAPVANPETQSLVENYVADRVQGAPPTVEGRVNYANPYASTRNNMGWINGMIANGAQALGIGRRVHYHGNAPGMLSAPEYSISAEGMPSGAVPTPTPRPGMAQADAAYGVMDAIAPASVTPVERGILADISPTPMPSFDMARFGPQPTPLETFDVGRFGPMTGMTYDAMAAANQPSPAPVAQGFSVADLSPISTANAAPMSTPDVGMLADQYRQYGMGQQALFNDPAYQEALARENLRIDVGAPPNFANAPAYVDPAVTTGPAVAGPAQPNAQVNTPAPSAPSNGLLSAAENSQVATTNANIGGAFGAPDQRYAATMERQMNSRRMLGGIAGGLLGGMVLGPVGAIAGGLLGRNTANRSFFPDAPEPVKGGRSRERDPRGSDAYRDSGQFRSAVDSGSAGLW